MTQSKQLAAAAAGEEEADQHRDAVVVVVVVVAGGVASEQVGYKLYQIELTERTGEFGELREREREKEAKAAQWLPPHARPEYTLHIHS